MLGFCLRKVNKWRVFVMPAVLFVFITFICASCRSPIADNYTVASRRINQTLVEAAQNNRMINKKSKKGRYNPPNSVLESLYSYGNQFSRPSRPSSPRFDLSVVQADVSSFFVSLAKTTGINFVLSDGVTGKITLDLKHVNVTGVMRALSLSYGYEFRATNYGYQVDPPSMHTRIFMINYLNIKRQGASSISVSANNESDGQASSERRSRKSSAGSQVSTQSEDAFWNNLDQTIKLIINRATAEKGSNKKYSGYFANKSRKKSKKSEGNNVAAHVSINRQSGLIVVRAYPAELDKVARFLNHTQSIMARQVLIEAKFLEVELNNNFKYGIDWNLLNTNYGPGSNTTNVNFDLPLEGTSYGNIFKINAHSGNGFNIALSMLSSQGRVAILSSPRITTLNNQKAVIKVGSDSVFVSGLNSSTAATSAFQSRTQSNVDLKSYFSGISLDITPQIDSKGIVTLHVHPSIVRVEKNNLHVPLDTTDGASEAVIPTAKSVVRESDSIVRAESGQVIILGGLMQSYLSNDVSSIPGLSSRGLMGRFRDAISNKRHHILRTELVILLRAVVVKPGVWATELDHMANISNTRSICQGEDCLDYHIPDAKETKLRRG